MLDAYQSHFHASGGLGMIHVYVLGESAGKTKAIYAALTDTAVLCVDEPTTSPLNNDLPLYRFGLRIPKLVELDLVDLWLQCRSRNFQEAWSARMQARAPWPHPNNGHHVRPWRMDRRLGPRSVKRGYHNQTR
jgi:hypothetical protein